MTAAEHLGDAPEDASHPLLIGVSPKVIASYLLPEDRDRFQAEYEKALDDARRTYELGSVHQLVERWRQVAALQSDPAAFRQSVRTIAEIRTGEPTPDGESFEATRRKAGM